MNAHSSAAKLLITATVTSLCAMPARAQLDVEFEQLVWPIAGASSSSFGNESDLSGDTLVVGAVDSLLGAGDFGEAYVYRRSGSSWVDEQRLEPLDPEADTHFGTSVAIDGDTIAVGRLFDHDGLAKSGAVHIFERSGNTWSETAKLKPSDLVFVGWFGAELDLAGDTLIVGAPRDDEFGTSSGAVYVFERSGGVWTEMAKLTAPDAALGHGFTFGGSLDLDLDAGRLLVGARVDGEAAHQAGAAYVFSGSGATWTHEAKLIIANAQTQQLAATRVALSGDSALLNVVNHDVVVQAPGINGRAHGMVVVFTRTGSTWSETQRLWADDLEPPPFSATSFGTDLVVDGDLLAVAKSTGGFLPESQGTYLYRRSADQWVQIAKLTFPVGTFMTGPIALDADRVATSLHDQVLPPGQQDHLVAVHRASTIGPWFPTGAGSPGTGGLVPTLSGSGPLSSGSNNLIQLDQALSGSSAWLVVGLSQLDVPFRGGMLLPSPDLILKPLPISGAGELSLPFTLSAGLPAGLPLFLQFWVQDAGGFASVASSNGLLGEVQ